MDRRLLAALGLFIASCGGSGQPDTAPVPSPSLPTRPAATPTAPLPPLATSTAAPTPSPSSAPATAAATATPSSPATPTHRGELVVPASTPGGVIGELPGGVRLGGPPRMPAQYRVAQPDEISVGVFASGLEVPWALAFAPDGRLFLSERPGRIRVVHGAGAGADLWATVDVLQVGEGGLMGLALDPDFASDPWVYICYTFDSSGQPQNRISRLRDVDGRGQDEQVLLDAFPGASVHDGCRLQFGPDGKLYATTGDAAGRSRAQDPNSLAGKILRLDRDGSIPGDNPFGDTSPVWSYGHRNPQGLAFDPISGALFATEHGPSGEVGIGANDEVNIIVRGGNYGWPLIVGAPGVSPYLDPLLLYPTRAVPPAGATFYRGPGIDGWQGDLLFTTLGGQHLQRIVLDASRTGVVDIERLFEVAPSTGLYGRLRDVIEGPDGSLYVATSNRDGRGSPRPDDDRVLRLSPSGR